jgi:hypothetical protein
MKNDLILDIRFLKIDCQYYKSIIDSLYYEWIWVRL